MLGGSTIATPILSVSGTAVTTGTTVDNVNPVTGTITLSDPTAAAHVGDGTETVTVTPAAAS